ncbi:MAG: MATE family efflux transporter [Candidatus Cloacimonetes bacterium]|nr:MATE family efflux transporter [Candidatus Cloacimonadota bacterium]
MKQNGIDLTRGSIFGNLMKLALPIMFSNFLQTFYNLTDTFWLGKLGDQARAAVAVTGLTFPLIFFLSSFGFGFVIAGTSLIAQYKGAGQLEKGREVVAQFILIIGVFCLIFITASYLLLDDILALLQTPPEILASARQYISIILAGMVFMFLFLSYQSFAHGLGDTISPMKIQIISVTLNLILDPLVIFGWGFFPRLEIIGAAYATLFSRVIAALIAVYFLMRKSPGIVPRWQQLRPNREMIGRILRISIPSSLAQSMTSFGFVILQGFVNTFGTLVISTFSIGNRLTGFFMMPAMGISNALAAVVGQTLGARKLDRALKSVGIAFKSVMSIMFVGCLLVYLFGAQLTRIFIDDLQVMAVGERMFRVTAFASFVFAIGFVFMGVFNGSGHTRLSMIFNISRLWLFRIPLVYLLSGKLVDNILFSSPFWQKILRTLAAPLSAYPYDALWWSMLISNILAGLAAFLLYRQGKWKKARI